ncbi:glycosyltransferase family 2 protein [Opitutus sp. ER46]|uniref:glycosyltransferase family 2 protein n=1 Tax=Opitutus sp. ER46 TaxID=2161864 RepID=UPI000D2FAADE|nr:glycosyltransferase family 2 protein [Opitutus sp. ER46]PTX91106.1 hypothetical protein DB354_20950 [Opitutus sp. ER46]
MSLGPLTLAIPNLNGGSFLAATLDSLAANRPHVCWHFQDGGSTDGSLDLARSQAQAGDHVVSASDHGQADALNRAFATMGGEVIGFLNSDDLLSAGAAANVVQFFEQHPEIDLVYGEVEWIDAAGAVTGHHAGAITSLEEILDIYRVWWAGRQWVQPEVFFRRTLWERVGPFDPRYQLAFDFDFWVRCFLAGARTARIPRALARFRLHAGQKSRAAETAAREIRDSVENHLAGAPIAASLRRSLSRRIDYDRYRLREARYTGSSPTFAHYLLTHPTALLVREVRQRIGLSCSKRFRPARPN